MLINQISKISKYGIFHDYTWPDDLSPLGRYNLFYGWNGSGKTSLSRLFRDLEHRRTPVKGEITININGDQIQASAFPKSTLPIKVFNRDFIDECIFPGGGGNLPSIHVFGSENLQKQQVIKSSKDELEKTEEDLDNARVTKESKDLLFDKYCSDQAKGIKEALRPGGKNKYNNYDKSNFQNQARKMVENDQFKLYSLDENLRVSLITQINAELKPKITKLAYRPSDFYKIAATATELLSMTAVSVVIESLKNSPVLSGWIQNGLKIYNDSEKKLCLFCDQEMPSDRIASLESHFSTEFKQLHLALDLQVSSLKTELQQAKSLDMPKLVEFYSDLNAKYVDSATALKKTLVESEQFYDEVIRALEEKKSKAFEPLSLKAWAPIELQSAISKMNELVDEHNGICEKFQTRLSSARDKLVLGMVADSINEYIQLSESRDAAENAIVPLEKKVQQLIECVQELELEIRNDRKPAEQINEDLSSYLGHRDLQLTIKDNGYSITRHGEHAERLSDGEMTAIALVYFLKTLEDSSFNLCDGVVVLDDPVSSLDSNSIFFAFGLIQERTKKASQLIILTHNFTLFRQVRNWFYHQKGQNNKITSTRPSRFYMLDCRMEDGKRRSKIKWLDPLLEQYETEYHYLFAYVYRVATSPPAEKLEEYYHVPNIARRLLESFLTFKFPQISGNLRQSLLLTSLDENKQIKILRFVHHHSHGEGIQPEHDPTALGECLSVLKEIVALMRSLDPDHCSAMIKLVSPPDEAGTCA